MSTTCWGVSVNRTPSVVRKSPKHNILQKLARQSHILWREGLANAIRSGTLCPVLTAVPRLRMTWRLPVGMAKDGRQFASTPRPSFVRQTRGTGLFGQ